MDATTKHTSERNGYRITVEQYMSKGLKRYTATVTNLTTGASEQTPGWSMYRLALEEAQETADGAKI